MTILSAVNAYERVIADLENLVDTFEPDALTGTLDILNHRVWELKNVFAEEYQAELKALEASKNRHPSRNGGKLPWLVETEE
jgi:hypothetical protein